MKGIINSIGAESITKNGYKVVNVAMENGDTGRVLIGLEKDSIWFKEGDEVDYHISENEYGKNIKIVRNKKFDGQQVKSFKDNSVWYAINNACLLAAHGVIGSGEEDIECYSKFLFNLSKKIK